jgi:uroporphyrin-III C-methyltransferase
MSIASDSTDTADLPVAVMQPVWVKWAAAVGAVISLAALIWAVLIGQKLSNVQEQLARQSAQTGALSIEAKTISREAIELARETAAKLTVSESRLNEVALQRSQLEDLMGSLSRTRDENLVVDIEAALRLAQQQAQLTGSVEPLLAALKSAEQRVGRAAQPRLSALQRAIVRDANRIKATALSDTPALLVKMDELVRLADELLLANAVGKSVQSSAGSASPVPAPKSASASWWQEGVQTLMDEARGLLRVSRIEQADSALLSPEQSFFVRENFKLKLLNARLGLLARQLDSSRADLKAASSSLSKYFDQTSRKTQSAQALLAQVQGEMRTLELPRLDDTLTALATAAAGR